MEKPMTLEEIVNDMLKNLDAIGNCLQSRAQREKALLDDLADIYESNLENVYD